MTKRISPIFPNDPPPDAPQQMWVSDATTADAIAARVPGAVGFVDLDRGVAVVVPGSISDEQVAEVLEAVRSSCAGG